jgi:hypothetical protein
MSAKSVTSKARISLLVLLATPPDNFAIIVEVIVE